MARLEKTESILIVIALLSLWPVLLGYRAIWYRAWLVGVLAFMVWVAIRRLERVREAAREAKRKRDEAERSGRPPWLGPN
jgi:hypothetical protein